MFKKSVLGVVLIILSLLNFGSYAQEVDNSSDGLFSQARIAAFDRKDYPKAISLVKKALLQSPNYTDLSVFLGRLYTWTDQVDSARFVFEGLESRKVTDEDFYVAYGSFLYWNDMTEKAIQITETGLELHPKSEDLLLLIAKISYSNSNYIEADKSVRALLLINPQNAEARALSARIKDFVDKNAIGINYSFTHFDRQFADNWHITSLSYRRTTGIGSVIVKANYANKFASDGLQFELESYPRISKLFYMYVGLGYSGDVGIFPKYRSGASLYANLPSSFEAEVGFRQLHFSESLWMFTGSVGKYYKNFWFNFRTYITPSDKNISHSYTGTMRYYTKGANDYFGFQAGTGISPEESRNNLLELTTYKLKTFKVGLDYNFSIQRKHLFNISGTYFNQEYRPNVKGNQFDISLGYSKVF